MDSLPRTSYLLVLLSVLDVGLVIAYCVWSVNRPAGAIEESLHISVALAVRGPARLPGHDPQRCNSAGQDSPVSCVHLSQRCLLRCMHVTAVADA